MFGFVKKLLGRKDDGNEAAGAKPSASPKPSAPAVPVSARSGAPATGTAAGTAQPASAARPNGAGSMGSGTVQVSLLGIVSLLPTELKPVRAVGDVAGVQLSFPERPILEQLPQGCVRVPFSEIRKLAPEGFFSAGSEHDQKLVELPLQELLPQLHSRSFGRRSSQKTTHVPDEVTSLFSARGNVVAPGPKSPQSGQASSSSTGGTSHINRPSAPAASAKAPAPVAAPASPSSPAAPTKPKAPVGFNGTPPSATQTASAKPAAAANPAIGMPPQASSATPAAPANTAGADAAAAEAAPPVSKPIAAPNLMAAMSGTKAGASAAAQKSQPAAAPTAASPAPNPVSNSAGSELVSFNLGQLSGGWPETVRSEITQWRLDNAAVAIPAEEIASALKQGRVKYTWAELLARVGDAAGKQSTVPSVEVELPLPIVAPAFLSRPRNKATTQATARGANAQDIPDLFHAGKTAASEAVPAAAEAAPAAPKTPALPGTSLLQASPARSASAASPAPTAAAAATPAPAASAPVAAPSGQVMGVPVAMIDESWPDTLKTEISRCQLPGIKLEMPIEELDRSLKLGKIEYTWRQLRSWVRPPLPGEVGADHADRLLTLPLKVVAPLFLSQVKGGQTRRKVEANSDIPDLFSGGPGGQPAPAAKGSEATAAAAPSNTPIKPVEINSATGEVAGATTFSTTQFFRKPPADLGELFGQPGKRNWTPNDIVQNTCRIRGVSGAVIAMQDGLLVSGQVASPWKSEATAAFLPQIYSRLSQYLKELGVGDMSSVTLNTVNGTLFVFNAGIIYFAVISKPDESVPLAPIKLIVSELSRHTK